MESTSNTSPALPEVTTRSVGMRYGVIYGAIGFVYFLIFAVMKMDMSQGFARWGTTLIGIVMIVLAHKYFKDNNNTFMTYGQGVGISFWLGLISSGLSSILSYVYIKFVDSAYIDRIREAAVADMEAKGSSEQEIEMAMKFMEAFTSAEAILLIGLIFGTIILLIVGLIVSIFTQKANPTASI
jgi:uncharacterized membrane protein